MTKEIDCRGLACPAPVLQTKDAIEKEELNNITVLVDNEASKQVGRGAAILTADGEPVPPLAAGSLSPVGSGATDPNHRPAGTHAYAGCFASKNGSPHESQCGRANVQTAPWLYRCAKTNRPAQNSPAPVLRGCFCPV